jgi:hypothetical protein
MERNNSIRAEINEIEKYKETMKQMVGSFKDMTVKPLAKLTKRRKRTQINKLRDEKGTITTNANELQRITRKYFRNLYFKKL